MRALAVIAAVAVVATALFATHRYMGGSRCTAGRFADMQVDALGAKIDAFRIDTGRLPGTLAELVVHSALGPYAKPDELNDPWGAPFYYRVADHRGTFVLFTLGADGRIGGAGDAADRAFDDAPHRRRPTTNDWTRAQRRCAIADFGDNGVPARNPETGMSSREAVAAVAAQVSSRAVIPQ